MYNPIEINSKFIELVRQNPNLPILAWVNYEVCCDDEYSHWLGEIQHTSIEEYVAIEKYGEDRIFTKDDVSELIDYYMDEYSQEPEYENMSDEEYEQYWTNYVNNLEWIAKITREVTQKTTKIKNGIKSTWIDKNGKLCHRYKYKYVTEEVQLKGYDLDNAIARHAVRKFNERWRKRYGKAIRHWLVTELGHNGTENIHLHGIIWTDDTQELAKIWNYGFIWDGKKDSWGRKQNYVSTKTINYIIKYVTKVDLKHRFYKQIVLTSAGIGAGYMDRTDWIKNKFNPEGETKEYYKTETGHKQALPIYWRNKIYSDEEREKLWLNKLDKQERYVMGIKISIKKDESEYNKVLEQAQKDNERLGYGNRDEDG